MPNKKRLIELAQWLGSQKALQDLDLPSEWHQEQWVSDDLDSVKVNGTAEFTCGTACCVAGHVALQDGGVPVFTGYRGYTSFTKIWEDLESDERIVFRNGGYTDDIGVCISPRKMAFREKNGEVRIKSISDYAADVLELSQIQQDKLFWGLNTYEDMIACIKELIA